MLLFFLFLSIILVIIIVCLILVFSDVKVIIHDLEIIYKDHEKTLIYKGKIGIYFLGKVKIFSRKLDSKKGNNILKRNITTEKIKKICSNGLIRNKSNILKMVIQEANKKFNIEKLKFKLVIDSENVTLTAYLIGVVSAFIPVIIGSNIKRFDNNKYCWTINSLFRNQNYIYLKVSSIISIRLVHIINMLKIIGGEAHERSSSRRFNVNCHGEH
ncbi:MAG: hypothetical protein IKQ33_00385 [Clostridia bacterium]|nr:hypothetical protein [Clostridia bacterium]